LKGVTVLDVIITTFNRVDFLRQTVESLIQKNITIPYRLFIIDDCSSDRTGEYLLSLRKRGVADVYLSSQRRGLAFGFDMVWHISRFFDFFLSENQYLCYMQDDLISHEDDWLLVMVQAYEALKEKHNIGFFSAYDCMAHPIQDTVPWNGRLAYIKKSQGMPNLIAEKDFFMSIGYVPKFNPDGTRRGKPDNGRGSEVDIYLTGMYSGSRFHGSHSAPNCSYKQEKNILVIPGLLEHIGKGADGSTWQGNR
jgi:glycosyltransferase involved in cell wall biosynthesis